MSKAIGPLGFPQTDEAARSTEAFMRRAAGPYTKTITPAGATDAGTRTEISWITTENPDRYNHIVIAAGMDSTAYQLNPIVTYNHDYQAPPVGISNWQRIAAFKPGIRGIKAETHYPLPPAEHHGDWPPSTIYAQITAGLLRAKSIGFIPLELIHPTGPDAPLVIKRWALIEYSVGVIPVNPDATIVRIAKMIENQAHIEDIDIELIVKNCLDKILGRI